MNEIIMALVAIGCEGRTASFWAERFFSVGMTENDIRRGDLYDSVKEYNRRKNETATTA